MLALAGCASTSQGSGTHATVAASQADAPGCRAVSNLNGLPSMPSSGEAFQDLKNQAVGGGNVSYAGPNSAPYRGTTYRCNPGSTPSK
jgi:hypothetical protein